jgi:hypothetical protein
MTVMTVIAVEIQGAISDGMGDGIVIPVATVMATPLKILAR